MRACDLKSARRAFSSLTSSCLDLVGPLPLCSFWLIPVVFGRDNTFFFFFRIHVIRLLVGISVWLCSGLTLLIALLWVYMFHMRCFTFSLREWCILNTDYLFFLDMLRCPPSSIFLPSVTLQILPCSSKIYIYHVHSSPLPSFFVITLSIRIRYAFYIVIVDAVP